MHKSLLVYTIQHLFQATRLSAIYIFFNRCHQGRERPERSQQRQLRSTALGGEAGGVTGPL